MWPRSDAIEDPAILIGIEHRERGTAPSMGASDHWRVLEP